MHLIRIALPALAQLNETLAGDFLLLNEVLSTAAGSPGDMPTSVLVAALTVLASAPTRTPMDLLRAGSDERRHALCEVAMWLQTKNMRPGPHDASMAVRVWGMAIARGSQIFGALASCREEAAKLRKAAALGELLVRLGLDLGLLIAAAESALVTLPAEPEVKPKKAREPRTPRREALIPQLRLPTGP